MGVVYGLSLRALLRERRSIALGLLAAAAGAMAMLTYALGDSFTRPDDFARLVSRLLVPTVTAFIALIVGTSAFGEEREDGSILHLAATPLRRVTIVAAKVLAAWSATMVILLPALAGFLLFAAGVEDAGLRIYVYTVLGSALAALAYCAVFVLLSLAMRRAVIAGILYIAIWEGSIASFAQSAGRLSIGAYGRAIAHEGTPDIFIRGLIDVRGSVAIVVLLAVTAVAVWLAGRRLARIELP
jgi:ABC-2 type transport system permease protein